MFVIVRAEAGVKYMDISIRMATIGDLPRLLELYKELQPLDPPVSLAEASAVWERAAGSGVTYFVAESLGQVVAACYIAIIPNITRGCSPIGFVENVVTAAKHRRQGIGRKLLEAAVEFARSQGCYKVALQSGNKRSDAHLFYEAVGFDGDSKRAFEIRF